MPTGPPARPAPPTPGGSRARRPRPGRTRPPAWSDRPAAPARPVPRNSPGPAPGTRRVTAGSRGAEGAVEAGGVAGVARALALLLHHDEQGVAVAVVIRRADPLAVCSKTCPRPAPPSRAAPHPGPAPL